MPTPARRFGALLTQCPMSGRKAVKTAGQQWMERTAQSARASSQLSTAHLKASHLNPAQLKALEERMNQKIPAVAIPTPDPLATIHATIRRPSEVGTRWARRLRKTGFIPSQVIGTGEGGLRGEIPLILDKKTVMHHMWKKVAYLDNTVFRLVMDEEEDRAQLVFPFGLTKDVVTNEPVTINFVRFARGRKVKIPLNPINTELNPAIRAGGYIYWLQMHLEIEVTSLDPAEIPKFINVDVAHLDGEAKVQREHMLIPPHIKLLTDMPKNFTCAILKGTKRWRASEADLAEEAEALEKARAASAASAAARLAGKDSAKTAKEEEDEANRLAKAMKKK